MDLMNSLAQAGGVDAISRELGVDQSTAQNGLQALLPAVTDGMRGQAAASPQGFGGLGSILAGLGGGGLLSNVIAPEPTNVSQGNEVLGQIFGNKDASRAVAADAAQKSGISPDLLKKMLPIVAMLVAGYLAKQHGQGAQAHDWRRAGASSGRGHPRANSWWFGRRRWRRWRCARFHPWWHCQALTDTRSTATRDLARSDRAPGHAEIGKACG